MQQSTSRVSQFAFLIKFQDRRFCDQRETLFCESWNLLLLCFSPFLWKLEKLFDTDFKPLTSLGHATCWRRTCVRECVCVPVCASAMFERLCVCVCGHAYVHVLKLLRMRERVRERRREREWKRERERERERSLTVYVLGESRSQMFDLRERKEEREKIQMSN